MSSPHSAVWVPRAYHLNVRLIDYEHGRLFALLRRLEDVRVDARWVVTELVDYADKHFFVEEELMRAYDYPAYGEHKQAHDAFRSRIGQLMLELRDAGEVLDTIRVFLGSWLVNHIDKVDRELAQWILEQS